MSVQISEQIKFHQTPNHHPQHFAQGLLRKEENRLYKQMSGQTSISHDKSVQLKFFNDTFMLIIFSCKVDMNRKQKNIVSIGFHGQSQIQKIWFLVENQIFLDYDFTSGVVETLSYCAIFLLSSVLRMPVIRAGETTPFNNLTRPTPKWVRFHALILLLAATILYFPTL